MPELAGKLTGNSIRVPTPNVSLAILNMTLDSPASRDDLNAHLRAMSLHSDLHRQIAYTDSPEVVSSDFLGSRQAGIVDGLATLCSDTNAVVYVWYDNEHGYSCQVIRVIGDHGPRATPSLTGPRPPRSSMTDANSTDDQTTPGRV